MDTKLSSKEKAKQWNDKKEIISRLTSQGLSPRGIEVELERAGYRITTQVREHIHWEQWSSKVIALFSQGFKVDAVEKHMASMGWIWSDNVKNKALWEYHRSEIIALYEEHKSVDTVQRIMSQKGFTPKARIYYDWLKLWGIWTGINRNISEFGAESHESPYGSNYSLTPGPGPESIHTMQDVDEPSPLHVPYQHAGRAGGSQHHPVTFYGYEDQEDTNVNRDGENLDDMAEDNIYETSDRNVNLLFGHQQQIPVLVSSVEPKTGSTTKSNFHDVLAVYPARDSRRTFYEDEDSEMSEDEDVAVVNSLPKMDYNASQRLGGGAGPVTPWLNDMGQESDSICNIPPPTAAMPLVPQIHQTIGRATTSHRASGDSGYASKTSSMQSAKFGHQYQSQANGNLSNIEDHFLNKHHWHFQHSLHSISCQASHGDFWWDRRYVNFDCCGSSSLQELAQFATRISSRQVHDYLSSYIQTSGTRQYSQAGNTFLHHLAITGAPWEYFEAALTAGVDPNHQNAFGQTFAHNIDISKFHTKLIHCLKSLHDHGFNLTTRDYSGRTILHCLYAQSMDPQIAVSVLRFFEHPGRQLSLRDVNGSSPHEIFKQTYLQGPSSGSSWSTTQPQLQILGTLDKLMEDGGSKIEDDDADWTNNMNDPDSSKLQNQYARIAAASKINEEAMDGSNAFHAQARLTKPHNTASDIEYLKRYIELNIDANSYDMDGKTPLEATIAGSRNYETELDMSEKVSLLVDNGGANVHFRNRLGHTPLHSAAIRGLDRTVEVLLRRRSHVNIRVNNGESLLQAVTDAGDLAFLDYYTSGLEKEYYNDQSSRIETCKRLLMEAGAVLDPSQAQAQGYP